MSRPKIFDCITFFNENLLANARIEILKDVVDYFLICESKFDHKGIKKNINFRLLNHKYKQKVKHIVLEENFPNLNEPWKTEEFQREKIIEHLNQAKDNDYIMYSDSDEIPNPEVLRKIDMKHKFGIFMQKFFVYKINLFNNFETPWEGTKITRKKYLKTFTHLRKKIKASNLKKSFWKLQYEKNIEIFINGGWHFNNLYTPDIISKKLKTFQHEEFSNERYSSIENIKEKIRKHEDLFGRKHIYDKIEINKNNHPEYIISNIDLFKDFVEK